MSGTTQIKVQSFRFGEFTVAPDQIIEFSRGLCGFEDRKRFALFEFDEEKPFRWLQSLEEATLLFVVVDPAIFLPGYDFELPEEDARLIAAQGPEEVRILVIVTLAHRPEDLTANLAGPLVIHGRRGKGVQVVLPEGLYPIKYNILASLNGAAGTGAAPEVQP